MEKFIKILLFLLIPFAVNAQVNGTIQKTPATGIVRGSFGSSGLDTIPIVQLAAIANGDILKYNSTLKKWQNFTASFGTGTVTSVSVVTANGVSGSIATATTTPAITLTLGAITPTSTNGVSAATMAFNDANSSIQTQLNAKQATLTPAALTKTDDTNVTLTLGGTPSTALLQASSLTLGWTGTLAAPRGGTGFGSYTIGDLLYASSTSALSKLAGGTTTQVLHSGTGGAPSWGAVALSTDVSGVLPPVNGGTGIANGTNTITVSGNTVIGSSTNTVSFATTGNTSVTLPTSGTLLTTSGAASTYLPLTGGTLTGDLTISKVSPIINFTHTTTGGTGNIALDATGMAIYANGAKQIQFLTNSVSAMTIASNQSASFAAALSVTGHTTFEGVTSTGATGTGNLVYATSPTLTTPVLGAATGTTLALSGSTLSLAGGSANALIGTSSNVYGTSNRGTVQLSGVTDALYGFIVNGHNRGYIRQDGTDMIFMHENVSGSQKFYTNGILATTITPSQTIIHSSLAGTGSRAVLADASGTLSAPISDRSVKMNIKNLHYGLKEVMMMRPVSFEYIPGWKNYGEGTQIGNVAQDMANIIPEATFVTPSTGKMGINYEELHGVYIKAMQEMQEEIIDLQKEVNSLKKHPRRLAN